MGVNELVELVNEDCKIRYAYRDEDGNTCVIGHLAVKAGLEHLLPAVGSEANTERLGKFGELRDALCEFYGVTRGLLYNMQSANDNSEDIEDRRSSITKVLRCPHCYSD